MGKVLLTLFYHPHDFHAVDICKILESEQLNGNVVPYKYSSNNGLSPDLHLLGSAIRYGCSEIVIIHSDDVHPYAFGLDIFSRRKEAYRELARKLMQSYGGFYGFEDTASPRTQIDVELNESNDPGLSIAIVKDLTNLLSRL